MRIFLLSLIFATLVCTGSRPGISKHHASVAATAFFFVISNAYEKATGVLACLGLGLKYIFFMQAMARAAKKICHFNLIRVGPGA
jgi:hypothetical protein